MLTPEETQLYHSWVQSIGSLQDLELQDPFSERKAAGGDNVWASKLPPTFHAAVASAPSSNPLSTRPTHLELFPFDNSPSVDFEPKGADALQYVALASTQSSHTPGQQQMPELDAFGLFPSVPEDSFRVFGSEHVPEIDVPASSSAWSSVQLPPIHPSLSVSDLHFDQVVIDPSSSESPEQLSYGTDPLFDATNSVFPAHDLPAESDAPNVLNCLQRQGSVENIRASSPQINGVEVCSSSPNLDPAISVAEAPVTVSPERCPPRKRGRSTAEEQEASPRPATSPPAPIKKRGRPSKGFGEKAAKAKKEQRVPLTREEQREHHVESEQQRRNRDSDAWKALTDVVPGLGDQRSKCGQAMYALNWLRRVLADNERMEQYLQASDAVISKPVQGRLRMDSC